MAIKRISVLNLDGIQSTLSNKLSKYYIVELGYNFSGNSATDVTSIENIQLFQRFSKFTSCVNYRETLEYFYTNDLLSSWNNLSSLNKDLIASLFISTPLQIDERYTKIQQKTLANDLVNCLADVNKVDMINKILNSGATNVIITPDVFVTGSSISNNQLIINRNDGKNLITSLSGITDSNSRYLDIYDSIGGTISTTNIWETPVPFNQQRIVDSDFSHNVNVASSEVTIKQIDTYIIMGKVSTIANNSNSRTQGEARLELYTGSTWSEVGGTTGQLYQRQSNYGASTSFFAILNLNFGDKLRINLRRSVGGAAVITEPNGSSLSIIKLKGVKGDKGEHGSGSNIIVQKGGTTIGSVTQTLNIEGDVVVTDEGLNETKIVFSGSSNQVDVYGTEYQYADSDSVTTTTSSSWSKKLRLTTNAVSGGDYRLEWYCEVTNSSRSEGGTGIRVQIDDNITVSEIEYWPSYFSEGNKFNPVSGFYKSTLSSGVHTIDLDFNEDGDGITSIRRARLEIKKIS